MSVTPYEMNEHGIFSEKEGQLTNFSAEIKEEIRYTDGQKVHTELVIEGQRGEDKLPPTTIAATEFPGLAWVGPAWGMACVVTPIPTAERHARTAIQMLSKPKRRTIHTHIGWAKVAGKDTYLTNAGALGTDFDPGVQVRLPAELTAYSIPKPTIPAKDAFDLSLQLLELTDKSITWPLWIATMRPLYGPADYAVHVAGRTGSYKSELTSLCQSHYGNFDARNLPGSWSSTANALEAQAYRAKDAVFVIDDFVPYGTAYQVRQYQKNADQLIRGQGNQAGRARLTDVSKLQTTMFPRGLILSTGEDTPTGHSIRARMLILEMAPRNVDLKLLTACQRHRQTNVNCIAYQIQWIAAAGRDNVTAELKRRKLDLMPKYAKIGHSRTPAMLSDLIATLQLLLNQGIAAKIWTKAKATSMFQEAEAALVEAAKSQSEHLETTDPVEAFRATLRTLLDSGQCHVRGIDGGVPNDPEELGWTKKETLGQIPTYTANGPKIAWFDVRTNEVLLNPDTAINAVMKASRGQIPLTKATLIKRIKDAGLLTRVDPGRQRNSIRVTCEGRVRGVLAIDRTDLLQDGDQK